MMKHLVIATMAVLLGGAAPRPVTITSYAADFDTFEARTRSMPVDRRVAAFRVRFERRFPGLYSDPDAAQLDRRIAKALAEFPSIRVAYRNVQRRFARELPIVVGRFRTIFPDFVPPLPIYLVHELGMRDGGSDIIHGRKVMLFGADVIAKIHDDNSFQPFVAHELFHLEHARHFADCDQFWCPLWQEGLATQAAAAITPGATDHQLLLDQPLPIRAATDAAWPIALCRVAKAFDSIDEKTIAIAFSSGLNPPGLPSRFGYYVGLRIAERATATHTLPELARMPDETARPVVVAALAELIADAHAPCPAPPKTAPITHDAPRSA